VALIEDRRLTFAYESEKDSFPRHSEVTASTLLHVLERSEASPDVVALSGWYKQGTIAGVNMTRHGAGYFGHDLQHRKTRWLGSEGAFFSSSHERSHLMGVVGMAPRDEASTRVVLVWEGAIGSVYVLDRDWRITRQVDVLRAPGTRYAFLYGLADPSFPDRGTSVNGDDSGKLMALAAFADAATADPPVVDTVNRILDGPTLLKYDFKDSPIYNAGVEAEVTKSAAALLNERIFQRFAAAAMAELPEGRPLHIGGGCGLNCDWNTMWRDLGYFSSVFVPPCANDSGSAIGTGIDALAALTGDPYIEWDVYCGLEFEWDIDPPRRWHERPLDMRQLAAALNEGRVVAWVQGRAELGPRALGNRSLLAEPFRLATRDRLNEIKQRESFRPIAPCCRGEDVGRLYDSDFPDPYMLYFRRATVDTLGAVTHVDGSARCQTVTRASNGPLHELLSAFAELTGAGVLSNTSLNFKGLGFINKTSDLVRYCQMRGVDDFVVGSRWFEGGKRTPAVVVTQGAATGQSPQVQKSA
jgi:hydroxymethyl cephem carbamoyltransferase